MCASNLLYKVAQIRDIEQLAVTQLAILADELMRRAGSAVFNLLVAAFPQLHTLTVVCGTGNNGGDGYVLARLAHVAAIKVTVYSLCDSAQLPPTAGAAAKECRDAGVTIVPYTPEVVFTADVIIDAVLGIGLKGAAQGLAQLAIAAINRTKASIVALDIPSGVIADSGAVLGEAVIAQHTLTFIGIKQGMLTAAAVNHCGQLSCDDLGLTTLLASVTATATRVSLDDVSLKPRLPAAHKGDFGHVLIVGGDEGMPGAVCLAAKAAARSGAGLVTVATRAQHVTAVVSHCPEAMCYGILQAADLTPLLARASVCILGPGLGQSEWSEQLFAKVIAQALPLVIDASGLKFLSKAPRHHDNWVLTPHPGEAADLLASLTQEVQNNRFDSLLKLQQGYGGTIVLKGAGSLIKGPGTPISLCNQGNPGMASGGMGDSLSGIIGGLIAQQYSLTQAAVYGVILHANAADGAILNLGQLSLLASDVIDYLPKLLHGALAHE